MSTLEEDRLQPKYRCQQSELYTVAHTIATSYDDHVADFMGYNARYTTETGTELKAAADVASALPDVHVRTAQHAVVRKELKGIKVECLVLWQQLASFIRDGFDAEVLDEMLDEAGHAYYADASNNDWEAVTGMMEAAVNFVAAHGDALLTGGMVAGFAAELEGAQEALVLKYDAFLQEEERAMELRDEKIAANNALYAQVMRMCKDGQVIFRLKAALRYQFTFKRVLRLVHGGLRGHGVSGQVRLGADGPVVVQAEVVLERLLMDGSVKRAGAMLTDVNGSFKFNRVRKGRYRAVAEKVDVGRAEVELVVDGGPVVVELVIGD